MTIKLPTFTFKIWHMIVILAAIALLVIVDPAFAAEGEVSDAPLNLPFWTLLAGSLVPLVGYVLNYNAPWVSEKVKALVQVIVAAAAGALFQLITEGNVGFNNETGSYVATTIIAALVSHQVLWKPSTISHALGAGSDRPSTGINA